MKIHYKTNSFIFLSGFLAAAGFAALSFAKYNMNGLSLRFYRFDYIGNILNLMIFVLLISGIVGSGFSHKTFEKKRQNFLSSLLFISLICIIGAYLVSKVNLFGFNGYIFGFPVKKVYIGFLFIVSEFILIYSGIYIWGVILGFEKLFELRTLLRTVSAVVLLLVFSLFFVWNVNSYGIEKINGLKFKYEMVPGAAVYSKGNPSPIFEARIRKAWEVFLAGNSKYIVLTGGSAPGEITEAESAFEFLRNLGIDTKKFIVENKTSTTTEQIHYVRFKLPGKKLKDKVLIVSDGFHLTRVLQICKFYGIDASGVASDYRLSFEKTIFYRTRESVALLLFWLFAV